jgi:hypothetical protein
MIEFGWLPFIKRSPSVPLTYQNLEQAGVKLTSLLSVELTMKK